MDSLVVADSNENEKARILRITLSTAFTDAASPYVRCFINKLKYGTTYSDYIEKKITKLESEFVQSTWEDLKSNYKDNKEAIEEESVKVDQAIDDLVDINIKTKPEEEIPLLPEELEMPKITTKPEKIPVPTERKEEIKEGIKEKGKAEKSEEEEGSENEEGSEEEEGSENEEGSEEEEEEIKRSEERSPFPIAEEEGAESENDE